MLELPWTEKITNEEVLQRMDENDDAGRILFRLAKRQSSKFCRFQILPNFVCFEFVLSGLVRISSY